MSRAQPQSSLCCHLPCLKTQLSFWADFCSSQQSATRFAQHRVKHTTRMKSNSTKCLRTFCFQGATHGGFLPPKNGLDTSRNDHTSPNSLLSFFFFFLLLAFFTTAGECSDPSKNARCAQQVCSDWTLKCSRKRHRLKETLVTLLNTANGIVVYKDKKKTNTAMNCMG